MRRILYLSLLFAFTGCSGGATQDDGSIGFTTVSDGPVDITSGPHTKNVMFVEKEQQPLVLMDMAPELPALRGLTAEAQKEYLLKRALATVVQECLNRENFADKDEFFVRMILLTSNDEYGRPNWGGSLELANLKITRDTVGDMSPEVVSELSRSSAQGSVRESQFQLENVSVAVAQLAGKTTR